MPGRSLPHLRPSESNCPPVSQQDSFQMGGGRQRPFHASLVPPASPFYPPPHTGSQVAPGWGAGYSSAPVNLSAPVPGLRPSPYTPLLASPLPPSLPSPLPSTSTLPPTPSYEDISDSEGEDSQDPFSDIPELDGFNLSGAGVALSRKRKWRVPSGQALSLWHHAKGGDGTSGQWRPVPASRVVSMYTGHEEAAVFTGQSRPHAFPLDDSANRRDEAMQAQQTRLGAAAHALCAGISMINNCTHQLAPLLSPSTSGQEVMDYLCHDVATVLGHTLRVLASEFSSLSRDRRNLCLNTVMDTQGRAAIERLPPSPTQLFSGDMDTVISSIKNRREVQSVFRSSMASMRNKRPRRFQSAGKERGPQRSYISSGRGGQGAASPMRAHFNQPFRAQPYGQPFRAQPYGAFRKGKGQGARYKKQGAASGNRA